MFGMLVDPVRVRRAPRDGLGAATSFDEFWPHYLDAHRHPVNRALHYVGTSLAVGTALLGVLSLNPALVVAALPMGYGPAWIGHFFFERNRPASFLHPLWSVRADFKMLALALESAWSQWQTPRTA
jgi:hypothetical protein